MDNMYMKNPEDEWDTQWFLLDGGIFESFRYDTFESFNDKLWQLIVALTSRRNRSVEEKQQLTSTLDNVVLMVKGCHYFLHHKKRLKFKEEWIDIKWLKNPYRCIKKYRSKEDKKLNHHLAHFQESFLMLSREEAQNFTIAFKNFFAEMDLCSWINLLDDWKSCLQDDESLFEFIVDYAPLKTYEKLKRLHEACIVSYYWAEYSYRPPNHHLIVDYLSSDYVDGYGSASPYEMASCLFYDKNYADIRQDILDLYPLSPCKKKELKLEVNDLRYTLRWLLETGWLFLQTDYFPEDWLDPDRIHVLCCPVPESELEYNWTPKSLSFKQRKNLRRTLSKLYYGMDVREEINAVDYRVVQHNCMDSLVVEMNEYKLKTRNLLLKTLDILTLIVLDLRKRLTDLDDVRYPPKSKEVAVTNMEDIRLNSDN